MEWYSIPEDLIIEIFTRLPVKSLIRFKCINKACRDLISSYDFATRHFNFNKNKRLSYIRMSEYRMQLFTNGKHTTYLRRSFMEESNIYRYRMGPRYIAAGSSSNGLVCFCRRYDYSSFTIWNPATGDFRRIQRMNIGHPKFVGFDVRPCGDYRVVVIYTGTEVVQIYSRSSNCWSSKGWLIISNDVENDGMLTAGCEVVSLDGCMYWRILGDFNDECTSRYQNVACFDMWEEKYRTISGPPWLGHSPPWIGDLGKLGVVNGSSLGFFFPGQVDGSLDGWVMNGQDGSWTKQYSVVPFTPQRFIKSLSGEEDADIIIYDRQLHFYDHATKRFCSFTNPPCHLDVVQYKEALFSVYNPTM